MKKNIGLLLAAVMLALSLSGCLYHRMAGPCYGVGCPAYAASNAPKVAAVPQAAGGNTQAQKTAVTEPAPTGASQPAQAEANQRDTEQSKPGAFTRMLTVLHLHSKS